MNDQRPVKPADLEGLVQAGPYSIFSAAVSEQGPRPTNQDTFKVVEDPNFLLYVVADGAGGCAGGELASEAVHRAAERTGELYQILGAEFPTPRSAHRALEFFAHGAQSVLQKKTRKLQEGDPRKIGASTQVSLTFDDAGHAHIGHTGDSRAYLIRGGAIFQITEDQTLGRDLFEDLIAEGVPEEKARTTVSRIPERNSITHSIRAFQPSEDGGIEPYGDIHVEYVEDKQGFRVLPGDKILLCSDGLTKKIGDDEIYTILMKKDGDPGMTHGEIQANVEDLVQTALDMGEKDNITAVLVGIYDVQTEKDKLDSALQRVSELERREKEDLGREERSVELTSQYFTEAVGLRGRVARLVDNAKAAAGYIGALEGTSDRLREKLFLKEEELAAIKSVRGRSRLRQLMDQAYTARLERQVTNLRESVGAYRTSHGALRLAALTHRDDTRRLERALTEEQRRSAAFQEEARLLAEDPRNSSRWLDAYQDGQRNAARAGLGALASLAVAGILVGGLAYFSGEREPSVDEHITAIESALPKPSPSVTSVPAILPPVQAKDELVKPVVDIERIRKEIYNGNCAQAKEGFGALDAKFQKPLLDDLNFYCP